MNEIVVVGIIYTGPFVLYLILGSRKVLMG